MKTFLPSIFSLVGASALLAQSSPPERAPAALDQMLVTAHPYARAQSEIAQPTQVLTGRDLFHRQAGTLGELLSAEPGVSSTAFGPGASRPIIRGQGGDRLRLLENGLSTLDASTTSPDHAVALDPLLLERVEIVRGPASLVYGSSAIGGVVNAITHRIHRSLPPGPFDGRTEVRLSSVNNEAAGGLVAEGAAGDFAWHVDGYRRTAGDVSIHGFAHEHAHDELDGHEEEDEPFGVIPNTSLAADGAAAGLSWVGNYGFFGIAYSGHNAAYGVPAGAHTHDHGPEDGPDGHHGDDDGTEEHAPVRIDLRQRRVEGEGELKLGGAMLQSVRVRFARSDYRHQELEGHEVGTVFTNRGSEARLELMHGALAGLAGALGVQVTEQRLAASGDEAFLPPSRTAQRALFLFEEAITGELTWQFGARIEQQELDLRDASGRHREDSTVSGAAGLVWNLTTGWVLAATLTHSERPPGSQELYSDGPHAGTASYERGRENLQSEASQGIDASLRRTAGAFTGALTGFVSHYQHFIHARPTGEERAGLPVFQYDQSDARFAGAELETVWHAYDTPQQSFDVRLVADLVRARNLADGTNLPRITPPRIRLGFDWSRAAWFAGAEAQRLFQQDHVAPNEPPTAAATLISAYAGRRFVTSHGTFEVLLRATNLTDEPARLHTSPLKAIAPLPGRNFTLAVRASF